MPEHQPTFEIAPGQPSVSVIMTVLNEEKHLRTTVAAITNQTFSGPLEIIIALGPSSDDTDMVAKQLTTEDARIHTVYNPTGKTPVGLNAALAVAQYEIIVRVDGHCTLPPDYINIAVETLTRTGAQNVGGIMDAKGTTDFERSVACAMTSPIGVGSASFHVGGEEGPAETVYLGVFRREFIDKVGGYDPHFERAQDWEMNHRIRAAGGVVWFTPRLRVSYRPRPTYRALAKQYFNYGKWRRQVMREHPDTVSLRYLAAPAAVSAMAAGAALGTVGLAVPQLRSLRAGWIVPVGYAAAIGAAGILISTKESPKARVTVPAVLATMHCAWGVGFLTSPKLGG